MADEFIYYDVDTDEIVEDKNILYNRYADQTYFEEVVAVGGKRVYAIGSRTDLQENVRLLQKLKTRILLHLNGE